MVELDNMKYTLSTYQKPLQEVEGSLDLENKEKRIAELDRMMEEPNFWENPEQSTKIVRENKSLKDTVERFHKLSSAFQDIADMIELGNEEGDEELIPEIREMLDGFIHDLETLKAETLLTGEYDANNAILRLNAGAGGTEFLRLVLHALSHVHALGRESRLLNRGSRLSRRRCRGYQVRDHSD